MEYEQTKLEEIVLALLAAFNFDGGRVWKGYPFEILERLHEQGYIDNPKGKTKSVWLTAQGLERGHRIAKQLFGSLHAENTEDSTSNAAPSDGAQPAELVK